MTSMTWVQLKASFASQRYAIWGAAGPPTYDHIPAKVGERNEQTDRGRQNGAKTKHDRLLDKKEVTAETWLPNSDDDDEVPGKRGRKSDVGRRWEAAASGSGEPLVYLE